MKTENELRSALRSIDHKSYPAYKQLSGQYKFEHYFLFIDHVQGDPFASPSAVHVEIPISRTGFPKNIIIIRAQKLLYAIILHAVSVNSLSSTISRQNASRKERTYIDKQMRTGGF